jgi:hypothetical protein
MTMLKKRTILTMLVGLVGLLLLPAIAQAQSGPAKVSDFVALDSFRADFTSGSINGTAYDSLTYFNGREGDSGAADHNFPAMDDALAIDWQQAEFSYVLNLVDLKLAVRWRVGKGRISGFTNALADGGSLDLFSFDEALAFELFEAADGSAEITLIEKSGTAEDQITAGHGPLRIDSFRDGRIGLYSVLDFKSSFETVTEDKSTGRTSPLRFALTAERVETTELDLELDDLEVAQPQTDDSQELQEVLRMFRQEVANPKGFGSLDAVNFVVTAEVGGIPADFSIERYSIGETRGLVGGRGEVLGMRLGSPIIGNAHIRRMASSGFDLTEPFEELLRRVEARPNIKEEVKADPWTLVSLLPAMDFGDSTLQDLTLETDSFAVTLAEFAFRKMAINENRTLVLDMDLADLDIPRAALETSENDMVWKYLDAADPEKLLLNFGFSMGFDLENRNLEIGRTDLNMLDLFDLKGSINLADLRMVEIAIPATQHAPARSEQQLVADLDRFELSLEDLGIVDVAAALAAAPPQTGKAILIDAIAAMRAKAAQASSPAGKSGYAAIADFLSHSGTLRIEAEPQQQVSVREAFPLLAVSLDFAAQIAGFRVTHEP